MRFFDASALVKRYVNEAESASVHRLLASTEAIVSRLSEAEVASSIHRQRRERALSPEEGEHALATLRKDLKVWQVLEVTPEITSVALRLLRTHPLRASDAIQLASALVFRDNLHHQLEEFVAFDRRLIDVAVGEGFTVL
jgi:predicted nucleic acid-binding protein